MSHLRPFACFCLLLVLTSCNASPKSPPAGAGTPAKASAPTVAGGGTAMELSYVPEGFPFGLSVSQSTLGHLFETPGGSQKYTKMPPDSGAKRFYDDFTIGGATHLLITEESKPLRMFFDENRNGDMTDDRGPFTAEKEQFLPNHISIQIRYPKEKLVTPYRLWLFGSNMGGVKFYAACHWRGALDVDGAKYTMVAFDGNADGDYANDPLIIDANGNEKEDTGERLMPGQSMTVGGKKVTLSSVSPSGLTVRLRIE